MPTDHERAVRAAERTSKRIGRLFDRGAGNAQHPRGAILTHYRTARRAMRGKLRDQFAVRDALDTLAASVRGSASDTLRQAGRVGTEQAERELRVYGITPHSDFVALEAQRLAAIEAILAQVGSQRQRVLSIALSESPDVDMLILGDNGRLGLLQPVAVQNELTRWTATIALAGWGLLARNSLEAAGASGDFMKQAIATIEPNRTTDTCIMVHGQVREIDKPFTLSGTPRYGDKIMAPPFHDYCRTASALVPVEQARDKLTQEMRRLSRAEMAAREAALRKAQGIQERLAKLGAVPDARRRADDTAKIKRLRAQLKAARKRPDVKPVSALKPGG